MPAGPMSLRCAFSFFNATATTEIYTLSLHDALPILKIPSIRRRFRTRAYTIHVPVFTVFLGSEEHTSELQSQFHIVCRLQLEKKKIIYSIQKPTQALPAPITAQLWSSMS